MTRDWMDPPRPPTTGNGVKPTQPTKQKLVLKIDATELIEAINNFSFAVDRFESAVARQQR